MAIGLFFVLSIAVFGSILYTCFTCVNSGIMMDDTDASYADESVRVADYRQSQDDPDLALKGEPIEHDSGDWKGIDRGFIVLLPY